MIVSDFGGLIHFEIRKQGKKLNIYVTNRDEIHGNFDRSYDFFIIKCRINVLLSYGK